ncbi:uncharacterized protein KD926_011567 [Aspergillus affinis]|uniref:uncharacterized protein n=1 Tax=Aspergillus affinis TaxID=1070780 RepID=UPI0022FDE70E|nr:uncharacterized protein KD926_011567 [Aspergillus affinis]KAI9037864.1 hypothetical protein KD926_011567 [Aspergillus affinis]
MIDTYKYGTAKIDKEGLAAWHRPQPAAACGLGRTSGNTIFFSALLGSPAKVTVSVGGVSLQASWTWQPDGDVGVYHGSVPFGSHRGDVVVTLERDGKQIAEVKGSSISTDCEQGLTNFNA